MELLPNSLECEKALLSSVLIDLSIAQRISNSEIFYDPACRTVYKAIFDSQCTDFHILANHISNLEEIGGKEYLSELFNFVPSASNWRHYYRILLDLLDRRRAIINSDKINRLARDKDSKLEEIEQVAALIRRSGPVEEKQTTRSMTMGYIEHLENVVDGKIKERKIEWGFSLSKLIDPLVPGELCLVGGRPGSGKTSVANCVVSYSCISQKIQTLMFSFEMTCKEVMTRLLSIMSRVPVRKIKIPGKLNSEEWEKIHKSLEVISNSGLLVIDDILTIHDIYSICRQQKEELGLEMVVIDYAQLTKGAEKEEKIEHLDEVGIMSKRIAKELDCVVMLLTQINREDNSPSFCSSLENHANQFIIVPASQKNEVEKKLFVRKNRNGPIGFVDVGWNGECAAFY